MKSTTLKANIEKLLTEGVAEVIVRENLERRLLAGEHLRIKLGIDPTSPHIHIGRAVVLWKLRAFQELGHQVVFIVGDFTGIIGDASDKESERPMLTESQIGENMKTYFEQAYKILDRNKTEAHHNSAWLKSLGFAEIGKMADLFGLHEFAARENIKRRLNAGKRVSVRELLYPLMQGYDSVAVRADVELGGTDQRFNLLAGRTIQPMYGQAPQNILTTELLEGTDGRKMSSSAGNVINITDEPNDMFGRVMALRDDLVERYARLAAGMPEEEIRALAEKPAIEAKEDVAFRIVGRYHGPEEAAGARSFFERTFRKREITHEDIAAVSFRKGEELFTILERREEALSRSEWRRLISQGAVEFEGSVVREAKFAPPHGGVARVGKKKFFKLEEQ